MKKLSTLLLAALLLGLTTYGRQSDVETAGTQENTESFVFADTTENTVAQTAVEQVTLALTGSSYIAQVGETELVDGTDASYGADTMTSITMQNVEESEQGSVAKLFHGSITVFDYADTEAVETAVKNFDPDDPSIFSIDNGDGTSTGIVVDYVAPITLWQLDNSIVLYCGEDDVLRGMLTDTLGAPFAGTLCEEQNST